MCSSAMFDWLSSTSGTKHCLPAQQHESRIAVEGQSSSRHVTQEIHRHVDHMQVYGRHKLVHRQAMVCLSTLCIAQLHHNTAMCC
jgi:hypothetical protein